MSSRIGNRSSEAQPASPDTPSVAAPSTGPAGRAAPAGAASLVPKSSDEGTHPAEDRFEMLAPTAQTVQARLTAGGDAGAAARPPTTDAEELLKTFVGLLGGDLEHDRKKRAKVLAQAILNSRSSRLKMLYNGLKPKQRSDMCEAIGDILDASPIFAQLVDNVTTEASGRRKG